MTGKRRPEGRRRVLSRGSEPSIQSELNRLGSVQDLSWWLVRSFRASPRRAPRMRAAQKPANRPIAWLVAIVGPMEQELWRQRPPGRDMRVIGWKGKSGPRMKSEPTCTVTLSMLS